MWSDIDKMSVRELDSLVLAAERRKRLLSSRRSPADVRRELITLAASYGYDIQEVIGVEPTTLAPRKSAAKRKRVKVAAKYRDPENKRNTWSGRGRMPRWLASRVKHGQNVADFLIPGLGRPTQKKSSSIGQKSVFKRDPVPVTDWTKGMP